MAATWRIKASCPCLRAWLSQHQNRKRERPGDSQEVGHEARKLTLQGLLSLEGPPEAPGTSQPHPGIRARGEVKPARSERQQQQFPVTSMPHP